MIGFADTSDLLLQTGDAVIDAENQHRSCVDEWFARAGKGLPPARLLQLFETAFGALWSRTQSTLGDVTVAAIVARVIYVATTRFPLFSCVSVEPTGIALDTTDERIVRAHEDELDEGIRFALTEFLMVLGNATAEVLTPSLHLALSRVTSDTVGHAEREVQGDRRKPPKRQDSGIR